jgi:hypothetical protein
MTIPLDKTGCPDLQELVERRGPTLRGIDWRAIHRRPIPSNEGGAPSRRLPAPHRRGMGRIRPGDGGMASSEKAAATPASQLTGSRKQPGRAPSCPMRNGRRSNATKIAGVPKRTIRDLSRELRDRKIDPEPAQ